MGQGGAWQGAWKHGQPGRLLNKGLGHMGSLLLLKAFWVCLQRPGPPPTHASSRSPHLTSRYLISSHLIPQVVEDSPVQMDVSIPSAGGKSASALLVPPLLTLLKAQDAGVRKQAAACLNLMARDMPGGLVDSLDK